MEPLWFHRGLKHILWCSVTSSFKHASVTHLLPNLVSRLNYGNEQHLFFFFFLSKHPCVWKRKSGWWNIADPYNIREPLHRSHGLDTERDKWENVFSSVDTSAPFKNLNNYLSWLFTLDRTSLKPTRQHPSHGPTPELVQVTLKQSQVEQPPIAKQIECWIYVPVICLSFSMSWLTVRVNWSDTSPLLLIYEVCLMGGWGGGVEGFL